MKKKQNIYYIALTGIMAALIMVFTAFFVHIPAGPAGGYIHFGDTLIYIAASVLPPPYACAAAAIGGGLADLMTAPMWIIPTVIIKALIVLPFTNREKNILTKRNLAAPWIAFAISAAGYYAAGALLFGAAAAVLTSLLESTIQSGASAVFYYLIGTAFDKNHIKTHLQTGRKGYKHG